MNILKERLWESFCRRYDNGEKFSEQELSVLAHTCREEGRQVDYDCQVYGHTDIGDLALTWYMVVFKCDDRYFQLYYEDQDEGPEWFHEQPEEVIPHEIKKIEWVTKKAIDDCSFKNHS